MSLARVAVTGLGSVNCLGFNLAQTWNALSQGRSGISLLPSIDDGLTFDYPVKIAGIVRDYQIAEDLLSAKEQERNSKFTHYSLDSAMQAYQQAGLNTKVYPAHRQGCVLGIGMGGFPEIEKEDREFIKKTKAKTSPFFITSMISNMAPGLISIKLGLQGANFVVTSACASAGHAITTAYNLIQLGQQDVILCGGAESVTSKLTLAGFHTIKALSTREVEPALASCPFDADRDGFVMSEGAAVLVLENYEKAVARGAPILAEIIACGYSSDANHITAPHPEGLGAVNSMKMALNIANLKPEQIDYINAHGTSTPLGDKIESEAIKQVFAEHAYKLNVSSTKSMTGHMLGAAAALESLACVMALKEGLIPPTINLHHPDPECDLNYTPLKAVKRNLQYVMNNSFGFGGTNSTIIFKRS